MNTEQLKQLVEQATSANENLSFVASKELKFKAYSLAVEVIKLREENVRLENINSGLIDNSRYQSAQSIKMMREISNLPIDGVVAQVLEEIQRATKKFPTWPNDPLHALAVISEEHGELCKATLQAVYEPHKNKGGSTDVYNEAIQTAAMAIRFLNSFGEYQFNGCEQHQQTAYGTAGFDLSGFNNPDSSVKYTWEASKDD